MTLIQTEAIEGKLVRHTLWARFAHCIAADGTSLGAGGQVAAAQADSETHGVSMATSDEIYWLVDPVSDLWMFNLAKDIAAEVVYTSTGGTADTGVDWSLAIKGYVEDAAFGDCKSTPDGSITFAAETTLAAGDIMVTPRRGFALAAADLVGDQMAAVALTLSDSGDASADEIVAMCVRLYGELQITDTSGLRQTM